MMQCVYMCDCSAANVCRRKQLTELLKPILTVPLCQKNSLSGERRNNESAMSTKRWGALPVSRIITIMKSSSDAQNIGKDSSQMMSKAAELFIKSLAEEAYKISNHGKTLDYKHLAEIVHNDDRYEFLRDIMPKKIKVSDWRKLRTDRTSEDEDTSCSSDESDSELSDPSTDIIVLKQQTNT